MNAAVRWEMVAASRPGLRVVGEGEASPYPKCSLTLRLMARVVDLSLAVTLYCVFFRAGAVVAILYILFADGMLQGQSIGKRLCGIKAVYVPTRTGARHRDSVLRNAPLGFIVLLSMMPAPLGLHAFLGGALVIGGVETWKVCKDPLGLRFGDLWAQTQVVDGKVLSGAALLAGAVSATPTTDRWMSVARKRRQRMRTRGARCGSR